MRRVTSVVLAFLLALATVPQLSAAGAGTAAITGVAQNSSGHSLGNQLVQVRSVLNGSLVATSKTSQAGAFTFDGLAPGTYVVEVVDAAGKISGASAITTVVAGATASISVTAAAPITGGAIATPLLLLLLAGGTAAAVTGVVMATNDDNGVAVTQASASR